MILRKGEKVFAALDVMGTERKGLGKAVYAWCLRYGFTLRDGQVIHEDTASLPLAVDFRRTWRGDLSPAGHREPKLGKGYTSSAKQIFPRRYWPRVFGNPPADLALGVKERVIAYYAARIKNERYLRREPPAIFANAHRHSDDIYALLNLKSAYDRVSIRPRAGLAIPDTGLDISPDRRFIAWTESGQRRHLYFADRQANQVYEVVNQINDWQTGLAWKSDDTLIFDQINGLNPFGDGQSHGVHLEIDAVGRRIVWAVPFGTLGFPRVR